ncbi:MULTISPECIES: PilZ domain-containing protein [Methylobacterium]|uniref:PilZ domain-containing protein n=1 Tax=Methylobacterium TaxID=407 RepID=UPI00082CFF02|nr:PilZ domain-containing protein [Methylobacterium sp. CCH5-D2]
MPPRPKRHRLIQQGRIVLGDSLVPCVIHDLSRAGAKIHLAARVELPGTFDLVIAGHDLRTVRASLRWRRGAFAGLAFLSPLP